MRRILGPAAALVALLCASVVPEAAAQSAPSATPAVPMWAPNDVGPMARVGNTLYVGGGFNYVGPPTGDFAIVDAADATQINTAARLLESTMSVVSDGAGGWFTLAYTVANNPIVRHILPSGAVDSAWTAPVATGGSIELLVRDGAHLFIAGHFTQVGATARLGIAALDTATGALRPWNAALDAPSVQGVFADSGVLHIFGGFRTAGGAASTGGAALDVATGVALPSVTPRGAEAASGNRLYARSGCSPIDFRTYVCAYDRAGVTLPTWVPPPLGGTEIVHAVVADASHVFALTSNGLNASQIHAYDPLTGAALTSWTEPTFTRAVLRMALDGGTLFVAGRFTAVNGQLRNGLAALDAGTGALASWAPAIGGSVATIAVAGGRVATGGGFPSAGGIARRYLAALDLTTGLPVNLAPTVTRPVTALVAAGDLVIGAEGDFAGGEIFGFSAGTGVKYPATLPYTGAVRALEIWGSRLFIAGRFAFSGGATRHLAAFDLSGAGLLPWTPVLTPHPSNSAPIVAVLRAFAGRLYVGGAFLGVDGSVRGNGAAFELGSLALTEWDPRVELMNAFETWQHRMLVNGGNGEVGNRAARPRWVDPVSGDPAAYPRVQVDFTPLSFARSGDAIIVAGQRDSPSPPGPTLIAIDPRTGQRLPWDVQVAGALRVLGFDDLIVVAGAFSAVGQQPAAGLAVFRTMPPAPPRNLTFDATQPVVTMAWTAAPGATPTAFAIEAGTAPGLGNLGRVSVGPATQISALVGPGAYSLRVFAAGPTGTSAASSEILFTRPARACHATQYTGGAERIGRGGRGVPRLDGEHRCGELCD